MRLSNALRVEQVQQLVRLLALCRVRFYAAFTVADVLLPE